VTPATPTSPAPIFGEKLLKTVEHELALHIGPLARILVKRAAKDAKNAADLASRLSENIPDETGRRAFESAVRRLH
jgi:serine/threonine-protein kinase